MEQGTTYTGDNRRTIRTGNDILRGMNTRVSRVEVIAKESEDIGTDALGELAQQRETLVRTRDRLTDANVELDNTNKSLKSMYRRVASNKYILSLIVLMELVIIGCQLYLKFFRK